VSLIVATLAERSEVGGLVAAAGVPRQKVMDLKLIRAFQTPLTAALSTEEH
jgi:hypothetical protein